MTSLQHLLPAADESVRCADHARRLGVDPGGTAIRADRVVLVPLPLPWPKPVFDHPWLAGIGPGLEPSVVPTRVLAVVPDGRPDPPVVVYDRQPLAGSTVVERRFPFASPDDLGPIAAALAAEAEVAGPAAGAVVVGPVVLVCTQGSHDVCCGSDGARFATEAEAIRGIGVHRVSHTGGHRFAPTAMTLPDGRMWADLDRDLLRRVVDRVGDTAELVDRCRGWWGAEAGPAQVAERAVFGRVGWSWEDESRSVQVVDLAEPTDGPGGGPGDGGGPFRCTVRGGDHVADVVVRAARAVPTIACRQPGGRPAKPATEYAVDRLDLAKA